MKLHKTAARGANLRVPLNFAFSVKLLFFSLYEPVRRRSDTDDLGGHVAWVHETGRPRALVVYAVALVQRVGTPLLFELYGAAEHEETFLSI